jgi:archaeal flagellar protein FlaI
MVSTYEYAKRIPDAGKKSIKKMAEELGMDVGEADKKALVLQKDGLIKYDGKFLEAAKALLEERRDGIKPEYEKEEVNPRKDGVNQIKTKADDGVCGGKEYKVDPVRVYEYFVLLWEAEKNEVANKFNLNSREQRDILDFLEGEGLISRKVSRSYFGLKKNIAISLPNKEKNEQTMRKYAPTIYEEDYKQIYKTKIECIVQLIEQFSPLHIRKLAHHLKEDKPRDLIPLLEVLADAKIIKINHKGANTTLERVGEDSMLHRYDIYKCSLRKNEKRRYEIEKDDIKLGVVIVNELGEDKYKLCYPVFDKPTKAVMERVYESAKPDKEGMAGKGRGDFNQVKSLLRKNIKERLDGLMPFVDVSARMVLVTELTNEMHLGRLEYLLKDVNLEEISTQTGSPVFIHHIQSKQKWVETNIEISEDELIRYSKAIARETKQQIDSSHPRLDAELHTKDRVNITYPEISGGSITMTVRIFSKSPWNFVRLIKKETATPEIMAFIWQALQYRLSVLFSGETGSGKTSFVNAVTMFLEKNDKIISIEDTRELKLPSIFKNWTHLTTKKGDEKTGIGVKALLENTLRQRPDRIILGEVRGAGDIRSFMHALVQGHPCIGTIHTSDLSTTIKRFEDAGVSAADMERLDLNVILAEVKDSKKLTENKRRIKEIGEYQDSGEKISAHRIFTLNMEKDEVTQVAQPKEVHNKIMAKVNMSGEQVRADLRQKADIIRWLVDANVDDIEVLGRVVQYYYNDPEKVHETAKNKKTVEELLQ